MKKLKSVEDQIMQANWRYLEQGEFIYYRAGRLDGRSGVHSLKHLKNAIDYAESQRSENLIDATPEELKRYNVWTDIKIYLEFLLHKLPTEDDENPRNP